MNIPLFFLSLRQRFTAFKHLLFGTRQMCISGDGNYAMGGHPVCYECDHDYTKAWWRDGQLNTREPERGAF